jgi:carboxypeptidase C (cathepsin A)
VNSKNILLPLIILMIVAVDADTSDEKDDEACKSKNVVEMEREFTKNFSGTFNGKSLNYNAGLREKILYEKDDPSAPIASFFYTEYIVDSEENRPVIFSFNGGPGSASLWLHMGVLGPKIVKVPSDASDDGSPPYNIIDNELSPLSDADLVFIDPVGTGYSRAVGCHESEEFWGVNEDPKIIAEFIRRWITDNKRWNSPRYILGESYGGIRGPLLVSELRSGDITPIEVNGLLLVAPASDYQYLVFHPGNNSPYYGFLPSYAATAFYHGKVITDKSLQNFYEDSKKFSLEEYGPALLKGSRISSDKKNELIIKYASFTGLNPKFVENFNMRVDPSSFRKELLRSDGYSVGRLDSRYKNTDYMVGGQNSDTDVSSEGFMSAYVTAMHTWFAEIGVEMKMLYQSGDSEVYMGWKHPQKWKGNDFGYVNTVPHIARAQRYNKDFKVYVSCGLYDLATPCFTAENFMNDNSVDMDRVILSEFEAGHMMYNHQTSFDRFLNEVLDFIKTDK